MLRLYYRATKPVMLFSTGTNSSAAPRRRMVPAHETQFSVSVELLASPSASPKIAAR